MEQPITPPPMMTTCAWLGRGGSLGTGLLSVARGGDGNLSPPPARLEGWPGRAACTLLRSQSGFVAAMRTPFLSALSSVLLALTLLGCHARSGGEATGPVSAPPPPAPPPASAAA